MSKQPLTGWVRVGVLGGALFTSGLSARADWLVLRDGSRLETRGPWQEKGKLVVFTRTDGGLASLRGSEVDLAASRKATEESLLKAMKPPEPAPAAPPKKLAVITDKDLPRRLAPLAAAPEKAANQGTPGAPVTVVDWKKQPMPSGEGIMIVGTLQNMASSTATNLSLDVSLSDDKGALLATAPGLFPTRILAPKGSVEFRANFQGVVDFAGVKFDAKGWAPEPPSPEGVGEVPAGTPPAEAPAIPPPSPPSPPSDTDEAPPPPAGP